MSGKCKKCGAVMEKVRQPSGCGWLECCLQCGETPEREVVQPVLVVRISSTVVNKLLKTVRERDSYQCQMPGCGSPDRLVVHTIVPGKPRTPENAITLCWMCKGKVRGHEADYIEVLQGRLADGL